MELKVTLKLVKKKVERTWTFPGANFKQVKEFLDSVEDAPDDAYVTTRNYFSLSTARVKWAKVEWKATG